MSIPFLSLLTNILYPRHCPVCHRLTPEFGQLICPVCLEQIYLIRQPVCKKCGKEVAGDRIEYCTQCQRQTLTFDYGFSLTRYDDLMKRSMAAVKYKNKREYLDFFSWAICRRYSGQITRIAPDLLVPVPVHRSRMRSRGFNQAEVLAGKLSVRLNIPMVRKGLVRTKPTDPQKELSAAARINNLQHAFAVKHQVFSGKTILLVDDIYTTGSTIEACSRVLKTAGASHIYFVVICIGGNEGG